MDRCPKDNSITTRGKRNETHTTFAHTHKKTPGGSARCKYKKGSETKNKNEGLVPAVACARVIRHFPTPDSRWIRPIYVLPQQAYGRLTLSFDALTAVSHVLLRTAAAVLARTKHTNASWPLYLPRNTDFLLHHSHQS